jgi:hypothetical protein
MLQFMLLYDGIHHSRKIFIARFATYIAVNITVSASPNYRNPQYIHCPLKALNA